MNCFKEKREVWFTAAWQHRCMWRQPSVSFSIEITGNTRRHQQRGQQESHMNNGVIKEKKWKRQGKKGEMSQLEASNLSGAQQQENNFFSDKVSRTSTKPHINACSSNTGTSNTWQLWSNQAHTRVIFDLARERSVHLVEPEDQIHVYIKKELKKKKNVPILSWHDALASALLFEAQSSAGGTVSLIHPWPFGGPKEVLGYCIWRTLISMDWF